MYERDCDKWVQGCIEWMLAGTKGNWDPYYIRFKMNTSRRGFTIPQMHDWIIWQFYWKFCAHFVNEPRSKGSRHLLPQLWLFPKFSNLGIVDRRDNTIPSPLGDELEFRGIILVQIGNRFFKKCPIDHIRKKQKDYTLHGIQRILLKKVKNVQDFSSKTIRKWGNVDVHNILILPARPDELINDAPYHHPREEVDFIQSTLMISRDVARHLWLETYWKEGLRLDPKTANVLLDYSVFVNDPYGVYGDGDCTSEADFVRAPGNDKWILWHDLPKKTQKALEKRIARKDY